MAHEDIIGHIDGDTIYWPITDLLGNEYTWPNCSMVNIGGTEFVIAPTGMSSERLAKLIDPIRSTSGDLIVKATIDRTQKVSAPPPEEVLPDDFVAVPQTSKSKSKWSDVSADEPQNAS